MKRAFSPEGSRVAPPSPDACPSGQLNGPAKGANLPLSNGDGVLVADGQQVHLAQGALVAKSHVFVVRGAVLYLRLFRRGRLGRRLTLPGGLRATLVLIRWRRMPASDRNADNNKQQHDPCCCFPDGG